MNAEPHRALMAGADAAGGSILEQLFRHSNLIIALRDPEGRLLRVSKRLEQLFNASGVEPLGKTIFEVLPYDFAQQIYQHDQEVLHSGEYSEVEEEMIMCDARRTYLVSRVPLLDAAGKGEAVYSIAVDITSRRRNEEALNNAALAVSGAQRADIFEQLVRFLAMTLNVDFAFIARITKERPNFAQVVAGYLRGEFVRDVEYCLTGTPCENVIGKRYEFIPRDLLRRYPEDSMMHDLGFESYAAYPLFDSDDQALGLIGISHAKPLTDPRVTESMLRIYSVRAAAEIERQRTEEALRASEEQYRAIFNASADGVTLWDAEGKLVDVNPAFVRMYGYSKEELLALDPRQLIHPDSRHQFDQFVATVRAGTPFHIETINCRKDGALFDVEVDGVPMEYGGQPHLLAFVRDITERKEREKALRASEEQYRAIFNASADGMVLYNSQGRLVDINPAFVALSGYTRDELLTMDPHRRFHPEAYPVLKRFLDHVCNGWFAQPANVGKTHVEETREITKDGRVLDMEAHLVAMEYQGQPHVLAIKRDITERKQREAAVRKSEDRLRATVEAALDCIISMDTQGRIIEFNPAAEACFGHRRDAVIGRPLAELLIPPAHRDAHHEGLKRYQKTGNGPFIGKRVEVSALRADGSEFPAELTIAVAQGPEGDIFVGYMRDITEQRRAEQDRARLEQQLRQAQKMEAIGHLTGGIAHDFNNILTSILGYTMMGQERVATAGDEKLEKYLQQIRTSGERARDLIRQMLTFSRGQRGEPRPLQLPRMVEESVNLFRSSFPSSVRFHLATDTAAAPVLIDPIQFEQVLMNLCINARDAMHGVGDITIGVDRREEHQGVCASCRQDLKGRFVELSVTDTGPGIPAEVLERMFEPFFTTKEVGQGSGMGLSTTHGIVHEYGGHIVVEQRSEGGVRFRVLFRAAQGSEARDASDIATELDRSHAELQGRVLVVDDEATVREFMRELLESRGLQVTVAPDGTEALQLLNRNSYDLVITDQTMPHLTGADLAYRIKALHREMPVILYSGFSDSLTGKTPEELGVDGLLQKPVDQRELFALMTTLLQL